MSNKTLSDLKTILNKNKSKCITVIGTTCTGKTTSNFIIYLKINDNLLKERTKLRDVNFSDAKAMQLWIEKKLKKSKIPIKVINVQ